MGKKKKKCLRKPIKAAKCFEEACSLVSLCANSCPYVCPLMFSLASIPIRHRADIWCMLSQLFKGRRKKEGRHKGDLRKGHLPSLDWLGKAASMRVSHLA